MGNKATTITWQPYSRSDFRSPNNIAGTGGFFENGMRWADYVHRICSSEVTGRMEELRTEILARGIRTGGRWHQTSDEGVPAWPDGVLFQTSWRGWADLMAAVWSTHEGEDYCYMDFYCDAPPAEAAGPEPYARLGDDVVVCDFNWEHPKWHSPSDWIFHDVKRGRRLFQVRKALAGDAPSQEVLLALLSAFAAGERAGRDAGVTEGRAEMATDIRALIGAAALKEVS